MLATGTGDSLLQLWNIPSGKLARRYSISGGRITGVAFSADDRALFTASEDGGIRSWDCRNGNFLTELEGLGCHIQPGR